MLNTPHQSPITQFTKKEEKKFLSSYLFFIGLVQIIAAFYFLDLPIKEQLIDEQGVVQRFYDSHRNCGKFKCKLMTVVGTEKTTTFLRPINLPIGLNDNVHILASYDKSAEAYKVHQLKLNGKMIQSYEQALFKSNIARILLGIFGLILIVFSLINKFKTKPRNIA